MNDLIERLRLGDGTRPDHELLLEAADALEALAQPEQEFVAVKHMMEWVDYLKRKSDYGQHMQIPSEMSAGACWELAIELEQFINTTPPQRKPLTLGQKQRLWSSVGDKPTLKNRVNAYGLAIEAAHGIFEQGDKND